MSAEEILDRLRCMNDEEFRSLKEAIHRREEGAFIELSEIGIDNAQGETL